MHLDRVAQGRVTQAYGKVNRRGMSDRIDENIERLPAGGKGSPVDLDSTNRRDNGVLRGAGFESEAYRLL
jgi:hypothetical protein